MDKCHNLFDTFDYPKEHFLYRTADNKVMGKMKCTEHATAEYVDPHPNMYSLEMNEH